jgi:5-methylcytosine-specific restriction endonuclease McrA
MQETKRCARCGEMKPVDGWPPGKRWADGLYPYCRDCKRAVQRGDHQKHRDTRIAKGRARYRTDPEPYKARARQQYQEDPRAWMASVVRWQEANPERVRRYKAKWVQNNLSGAVRENVRRRYARRKGAPTINFSASQLAQRKAFFGGRCWMCGRPAEAWDHVKPLAKGGWHCLSNLRPACMSCNAKKRDTWPFIRREHRGNQSESEVGERRDGGTGYRDEPVAGHP